MTIASTIRIGSRTSLPLADWPGSGAGDAEGEGGADGSALGLTEGSVVALGGADSVGATDGLGEAAAATVNAQRPRSGWVSDPIAVHVTW
jgi:hypothetical protein